MIIQNNTIRIGNFDYTVDFTDEPIILGNQLCYGICDVENQLIQIDSKMTEQNKERVIFHEVFHGLAEFLGLDFGEDNEHVIDSLARGIMQLRKDNPLLFVNEDSLCAYLGLLEDENEECDCEGCEDCECAKG